MIMAMKIDIHNCLISSTWPSERLANERMACGIKSPMMMRYETPTPKHFIAIARSKKIPALG